MPEHSNRSTIDHDVTVRRSPQCWEPSCSCGWQWPPCLTEETARDAAAIHYLEADGSLRRHPAGGGRRVPTTLTVDKPSWLTATGDGSRVEVYRSPLVTQSKRMIQPVLGFIADHGLHLVYTETDAHPDWMHGQRVREIYASCEAGLGDVGH